jgi:hypothetical protein
VTDYCTLSQLKAEMRITDTVNDSQLTLAIAAASRWIDRHCRRRFFVTAEDEVRYFTASKTSVLRPRDGLDDIVSVTEIAVDLDGDWEYETIIPEANFTLLPANVALEGWPYTKIGLRNGAVFSLVPIGNRITGKFGFPEVPDPVTRACILQAQRSFLRKDAPYGQVGVSAVGQYLMKIRPDEDVLLYLNHYVRKATVLV